MRPLNQSHQRATPEKFSRMQASSSKFCGTKVLSSLTLLLFNRVEKDAAWARCTTLAAGANFARDHAAHIYN